MTSLSTTARCADFKDSLATISKHNIRDHSIPFLSVSLKSTHFFASCSSLLPPENNSSHPFFLYYLRKLTSSVTKVENFYLNGRYI